MFPEDDPLIHSYLLVTHPAGPALSLRNSRVEYIKTRPSNTLITYASYGNELSWTVEDCCCLWQLIIWPIDQNCSTHHRALCPLHLLDHHSLYLSGWGGASVCVCVSAGGWLNELVCVCVIGTIWLLDGWINEWMERSENVCVCIFAYMRVYLMKSKMIPKLMISYPHMQHRTFI